MKIGDIEIPILLTVEEGRNSEVDEITPLNKLDKVTVNHESKVTALTITGYLNQHLHSQSLTLERQRKEIKKLRNRSKLDNSFTYGDYKGYLLVEEVEIPDNSDSKIVDEVVIEARYFPWPKYYPENEP